MNGSVLGIFKYQDDFLDATRRLHQSGFEKLTMMSPIPMHEIEAILRKKKPVIRRFSLAGAIFGAIFGFAMATGSALSFIQPTGGRPIIPFPPFLVISYEMTILFGVLATLIGFHVASGLPAWRDKPYVPETNVNRFSILVEIVPGEDVQQAERILRDAGAEEIRYPGDGKQSDGPPEDAA